MRRFSMPPMLLSIETNKSNNNFKSLFQKNRFLFQIDANKINKKLHTNKQDENEETKRRKLLVKYEQHIQDSFSEISNTLKHYEIARENSSKKPIINNALHRLSNSSSNSEEGYYSTSSSSSSSSSSTSTKEMCSNIPAKLSQEDSSSSSSSPKMESFYDDYENVHNGNNKSFLSNAVSTLLRRGRLNASFNDLSLKTHNIEQTVNDDDDDDDDNHNDGIDRTNLSKRIKQFLMSASKKTSQIPKRSSSTNYFDRLTAHVHFNLTSTSSASSSSNKSNQFLTFKNKEDKKQTLNTNVKMLITKFECKQTKF
jgi:hypothetical protein